MGTLNEDLLAIKEVEDTLIANKVARFAYTDTAYADNDADGVDTYDYDNEQNIPNPITSVLKVNATVLDKGYRAQASSITRMLINHFFGRVSYNLNKINDNMSALLNVLRTQAGAPNGIATLDNNGYVIQQAPLGSPYVSITKKFLQLLLGDLILGNWFKASDSGGKVVYVNGMWFCHDDTDLLWSMDGETWTPCVFDTSLESNYDFGLDYHNGIYVLIQKGVWWSEDGKNWTISTSTAVTTYGQTCLTYANGLWACIDMASGKIIWSEDGKNWSDAVGTTDYEYLKIIKYADNIWVACSGGTNGNKGLLWSEDGKNWYPSDKTSGKITCLTYDNGVWICGTDSSGVWRSTNGKNWTQGIVPSGNLASDTVTRVLFGNGAWLCVTNDTSNKIWQSSDNGVNWYIESALSSDTDINYVGGVWFSRSQRYFHTNYNRGGAWKTVDTQSLQPVGSNLPNLQTLIFINGMWIGTDSGRIYFSKDTVNWQQAVIHVRLFAGYISLGNIVYADDILLCPNTLTGSSSMKCILRASLDDLISNNIIDLGANIPLVD